MLRSATTRATAAALAVLLCVFVIRSQAQPAPSNISAAREAMAAGFAATRSGDLAEAKRAFARAVALAPKIWESHAALGGVLLAMGDAESAAKELNVAHGLAPGDAAVSLNLANADAATGRYGEAAKLFGETLAGKEHPSLSPQDAVAYGRSLAATGQAFAAEGVLRDAVTASPDAADLHDALGTLLAKRGALVDALPLFERAVELDPLSTQAQFHLGAALLALNRPAEALESLKRVAAAQPRSFEVQVQLGQALSALHRDTEALAVLHHAAEIRGDSSQPEGVYALALALQASGDSAGALPVFEQALRLGSVSGTVTSVELTNYALAKVQTGDGKGALSLYERALKVGPDSTTLREDFGVAYLQQADLDHAIVQFKAGLALDPNDANLHYDLGLALKLKDDLPGAVAEFERSAQLDSTLPDPPYTLGVIYMQQGQFADAAIQLKRATALQPNNGDAWALLGSVLKESGDAPGAVEALKRAIELEPEQPSLHIQLAGLEIQAGDKAAAAADRKIAAELSRAATSRQRAGFALKSGRALLADGKVDDAIYQLTIALQAEPSLIEAHKLMADAYTRKGRIADAALERKSAAALEVKPAPADGNP